jgi:ABC-type glycerol-3-phosphate transport system substrate-binding protein
MRKLIITAAALALVASGSTACATKKFVTGQVGQVSTKVDSLSKSLEETQERTKANEAKIGEVDAKVTQARGAADTAQQTAVTASHPPSYTVQDTQTQSTHPKWSNTLNSQSQSPLWLQSLPFLLPIYLEKMPPLSLVMKILHRRV